MYKKIVETQRRFVQQLERGELIDPSIIETELDNLVRYYKQWVQFTNGKPQLKEELKKAKT